MSRDDLRRAVRDAQRTNKHRKLLAAATALPATTSCDLRVCSMQTFLNQVRDIDTIITDPPYAAESTPLYGELARLAKVALKPDGILCVMVGHAHLPQVLAAMTEHVRYLWPIAYLTPGSAARIWNLGINVQWKPVVLFSPTASRLAGGRQSFCDVVKSDSTDKRFHEWGQSESGMTRLVESVSSPGDLVCDPFLGSGTTAVACVRLGRRIIGCDIDSAQVETARARVALELKSQHLAVPAVRNPVGIAAD